MNECRYSCEDHGKDVGEENGQGKKKKKNREEERRGASVRCGNGAQRTVKAEELELSYQPAPQTGMGLERAHSQAPHPAFSRKGSSPPR